MHYISKEDWAANPKLASYDERTVFRFMDTLDGIRLHFLGSAVVRGRTEWRVMVDTPEETFEATITFKGKVSK
jgi:hypothetical protein